MVELNTASVTVNTSRKPSGPMNARLRAGRGVGSGKSDVKNAAGPVGWGLSAVESDSELGGRAMDIVKHYDADGKRFVFFVLCCCSQGVSFFFLVLTKVFVYCGISILACGVMPVVFVLLGWGLRP